jgi:hypothetical protein
MRSSSQTATSANPTCLAWPGLARGPACSCTATATACLSRLLGRWWSSRARPTRVRVRVHVRVRVRVRVRVCVSLTLPGICCSYTHWPTHTGQHTHHSRATPSPPPPARAGEDVCREVAAVAEQVVVAARSWKHPGWASDPTPFGPCGKISRRGMVSALLPGGGVEFTQVRTARSRVNGGRWVGLPHVTCRMSHFARLAVRRVRCACAV